MKSQDWQREFKKQLDFIQAKNNKEKALECFKILHLISSNIISNPHRQEFKMIKERGKSIHKVLDCEGGLDIVFRFSKKKVQDFECIFEFEQIDPQVLPIIEFYIGIVEKQLEVKMSAKEEERLYKERILLQIEEDRQQRLAKQQRSFHLK